ncbi:ParB/RepB/Spo0J family partition protein [Paraburkholderia hospita]|uniref:ParB/RepB/Spo0J family partition protein n=1 Tax=Paraburkholderia hospita TaxID=169430 RepID=UPI0008A7A4F9|nr:ParB/RepB/Spo0J family partition protein [Paraburkholderia hospita]SEI14630.1 chromosome partitioning protein, ParB family [Paraburkholderia hospita]
MSSNIREQLMAKTAGIATPAELRDSQKEKRGARSPQTMPGITGALAAAQLRISQLEQSGVPTDIAVGAITPNPWQPRRRFDEAKMSELARSIAEAGLLQPVVLRSAGETYQLVAGERRWRAHKLLMRDVIRAVVIQCSDEDMAALALMENFNRDDLTDYEIAISVRSAESEFPNRTRLAKVMGISRADLYRYLSYDDLPDFVRTDLDVNPVLLAAKAAQEVVAALKKTGDQGVEALREIWPQVVSGDLVQSKLAGAVITGASRGPARDDGGGRSIMKIFAGKAHAGSITKDQNGLTFKFKAGAMTVEQEEELREYVGKMFSIRAE